MDDPKVVILLFASGKLVCTGAKDEPNLTRIWVPELRPSGIKCSRSGIGHLLEIKSIALLSWAKLAGEF